MTQMSSVIIVTVKPLGGICQAVHEYALGQRPLFGYLRMGPGSCRLCLAGSERGIVTWHDLWLRGAGEFQRARQARWPPGPGPATTADPGRPYCREPRHPKSLDVKRRR